MKKPISSPYYNIAQLRLDFWKDLKKQTNLLANCLKGSKEEKEFEEASLKLILDLGSIESYFTFPGINTLSRLKESINRQEYNGTSYKVIEILKQLVSNSSKGNSDAFDDDLDIDASDIKEFSGSTGKIFDVLFVEDMSDSDENQLRHKLEELTDSNDQFNYGVVVQRSFQDALIALTFNYNIQAVVIRYAPPYHSKGIIPLITPYIQNALKPDLSNLTQEELGPKLGKMIKQFRPELDIYYVTDTSLADLKDSTLKNFKRIFYQREDLQELHLMIIRGIRERYETPFFSALVEYSQKPTGVFHAMPISRGNSVFKSRWIKDFGDFYGRNMFLAETSATTGGLDSLLQPTGPLKKAQEMARDAYGSQQTFCVTN
jgi:arginine decarboxylase